VDVNKHPSIIDSEVKTDDATHMHQNGMYRFITHIMGLSGKSRAGTKVNLECLGVKREASAFGFYCGERVGL
jgi:hypothetical protein